MRQLNDSCNLDVSFNKVFSPRQVCCPLPVLQMPFKTITSMQVNWCICRGNHEFHADDFSIWKQQERTGWSAQQRKWTTWNWHSPCLFPKEKGEKKSMPKNHIVWKSNKSSTNSQHIWRFMLGSFEFVFITVLNNDTKQDPNLGSRSCPHCGTSFGNAASCRDGWEMVRDGKGW